MLAPFLIVIALALITNMSSQIPSVVITLRLVCVCDAVAEQLCVYDLLFFPQTNNYDTT